MKHSAGLGFYLFSFLCFLLVDSSSPISFNYQDPPLNFFGRENYLLDLKSSIDSTLLAHSQNQVIESPKQSTRLKLVIGRKGSGKSEVVRKFIYNNMPQFHSIIWIRAHDRLTLENSFLVLAAQKPVQVDTKYPGPKYEEKSLRNLVTEIYWKLGNSSSDNNLRTLMIFDGAQTFSGPNGIESFLPEQVNRHSPIIIVTTSNIEPQDWGTHSTGDIFPLNVFSMDESVGYILKQFSSTNLSERSPEVTKKEAMDLAQNLRRRPLSLHLAMSYIIQDEKEKQNSGPEKLQPEFSPILEYLTLLEKSRLKLPPASYNDTVSAVLFVTLNKLQEIGLPSPLTSKLTLLGQPEKKVRNLPCQVLDALAMLSAGQHVIPVQLLHQIFTPEEEYDEEGNKLPRTVNPEDVVVAVDSALAILNDYGLIRWMKNYRSERRSHIDLGVQIHGLLEVVLFKELKTNLNEFVETWSITVKALNRILVLDLKKDELKNFTSDSQGLWSIMTSFVDRRRPEDLKLFPLLQEVGIDHEFMSFQMHLALGLYFSSFSADPVAKGEHGRLIYTLDSSTFQKKAISLLHLLVKDLKVLVDDFMSTDVHLKKRRFLNVPMMIFAYRSPKYVSLHQKVYDLFQKTFGDTNTFTIYALEKLASVYNESGHLDQAFTLYQSIFHMQQEEHGIDKEATIRALQDVGRVLFRQKNYDEAIRVFKEAHKIGNIALGDDHTLPLQPFLHMLQTHTEEGDYPRALGISQLILDLQRETLGLQSGDDGIDPRILKTLEKMADLFDKIGKTDKALKIYERLLKAHEEKVKADEELYDQSNLEARPSAHLDELEHWRISSLLGGVHEKRGNIWKALRIFKDVWEGRKKKLGEFHKDTVHSHAKLAHLFYQNGDYENARSAISRVIEKQKLVLGYEDSHPEVVKMLETKKLVQEKLQEMTQSDNESEEEPQKPKFPSDEL